MAYNPGGVPENRPNRIAKPRTIYRFTRYQSGAVRGHSPSNQRKRPYLKTKWEATWQLKNSKWNAQAVGTGWGSRGRGISFLIQPVPDAALA